MLTLCFMPALAWGYEFDVTPIEYQPFDENKFELFQDDINGDNAMPVEVISDIQGLKFDAPNNGIIKELPDNKGAIIYLMSVTERFDILASGYYPYTVNIPKNGKFSDKRAFKITVKTKGQNPADFKAPFSISSVREDIANLYSVSEADGKPVIIVKTDLPFEKIDGSVFKETGAFLMQYENCGPYYYTVLDGNSTLKDILLPDVLTQKDDGTFVPAKDNAEISAFKLKQGTTYYMYLVWGAETEKTVLSEQAQKAAAQIKETKTAPAKPIAKTTKKTKK